MARDLEKVFAGTAPAVSSPQGRFTDGAALLDGVVVEQVLARGKHLLIEFANHRWLNVHLGLIGKLMINSFESPLPREQWAQVPVVGQVRLRMVNEHGVADLRGATRCVVITPDQAQEVIDRLGPDPLQDQDFSDAAWRRLRRSRRSVAELLMDQSILAGVGNVYRSEVLFRHRVNPFVTGETVKLATWQAIWADLQMLMPLGVATGQIITLAEQVQDITEALQDATLVAPPERAYYVYRRTGQPCRVCGHKIRTQLVAGRNLFWCGTCQRRH